MGISRQVSNNLFYENELPLVNGLGGGCRCSKIMSSLNCNETLSPYLRMVTMSQKEFQRVKSARFHELGAIWQSRARHALADFDWWKDLFPKSKQRRLVYRVYLAATSAFPSELIKALRCKGVFDFATAGHCAAVASLRMTGAGRSSTLATPEVRRSHSRRRNSPCARTRGVCGRTFGRRYRWHDSDRRV